MEDFKFNKNLPENIKNEMDNVVGSINDIYEMAKEEFPDNERAQELVVKENLGDITKKEQKELYKMLDEKKKRTDADEDEQ